MKLAPIFFSLLFFNLTLNGQIDFKTWKEDVTHKVKSASTVIPYDSTIIVQNSVFNSQVDSKNLSILVDYCNESLMINYMAGQQKVNKEYDVALTHFNRYQNERKIFFKINDKVEITFYKSEDRFEILEVDDNGVLWTWTVFSGEGLSVQETGEECKTFYDEIDDLNLYKTDLSGLDGNWFEVDNGDTTWMLIRIDSSFNNTEGMTLCGSNFIHGVYGDFCVIHEGRDSLFCSFYVCASEMNELRMLIGLPGGTYDDAYIRKLTNRELIIDYIDFYFHYRREEN
ncbi:MAG: hypothetical protein ACI8ZM_000760 [Crocinitomix sp.]|jgi:hypothetical protein